MDKMTKVVFLALIAVLLVTVPAQAQTDKQFAVRAGLIYLDPTADTDTGTTFGTTGFDSGGGFEFNFEWYFNESWGLEGDFAMALDVDVDDDDDTTTADGVTIYPLTAGLNWHPVRNERIDWSIGVVAGIINYTDFEWYDSGSSTTWTSETDSEPTWGVQTSIDFNIGEWWAVNAGIKYLEAEAELSDVDDFKFDVDPIIIRVMGVFRW